MNVQEHIPCGASAWAVEQCCDETEYKEIVKSEHREDCVENLLEELIIYGQTMQTKIDNVVPMNLTPQHEIEHSAAQKCHICNKSFTKNSGSNTTSVQE